jgi:hypothetical protein
LILNRDGVQLLGEQMATQNINIGVNVSDNGTAKKVVKNFEEITQAATRAQQAAQGINAPGGTTGSRGVAAKAAPSGSQNMMSGQEYGAARGSAGLTGASARDFAAQSQGLGGLVRLYATYAANVFAVSAAFGALKSAMDTTNMVAGLNQLGAATGTNLGSLSKRLVTLTDGAISFRDAMDAVAKTTSSGMSSKDVERLAVVAKNASLALGVSMPDAINRLSRGISKLEPELLDELGIFTKIDPAVQAYARSVGKAASQLTDFERRQAFANAVLLEGESKFGELATAAVNPYDRLLATLKNVSQEALQVVNSVLGPIVSLLASSPTALAGALAVIGTLLVRQAIPALTEFKAGLAAAADTAAQVAKRRADDAISARKAQYDAIESIIEKEADLQIDKADQVAAKLQASRAKSRVKAGGAAMELIDTAPQLRTKELYAQAQAEADLVDQEMKAANKRTKAGRQTIAQRLEEKNAILDTIAVAKEQQKIEESLQAKKDTRRKELDKEPGRLSPLGLTLEASAAAQDAAVKKGIISNAAYNASLIGLKGSFVLLETEIVKAGLVLSAFDLKVLKARAGIAMFIGVLGTLGGAVNKALGALAIITTVLGIFDTIFSKSSKEMDKFSASLDKVDEAAANASRTLEFLNKKGGYASATIQGINSMANALNELSAAAEEAVTSAKAAQKAMGGYDAAKDYVKSLFGGGIENDLADSLAKNLRASLDILATSGIGQEAAEKFKKILNVDSLDTETAREAILKLSDASKGDLVKALAESNTALNNSASKLQSFKSATEATTKAYQDFIQSTASNNPIFKLGTTLENLGKTMSDVLTGGAKEMEAAMLDLANSPEKGALFGSDFTTKLVEIRQEFLNQSEAVTTYQNRLNDLNKELEATRAIASKPLPTEGWQIPALLKQNQAKNRVKQLESDIGALQKSTDALPMDKIKEARDLFSSGVNKAFEKGAELIEKGLGQAADKAAQTIAKARLGGLSGEARAIEETRLAKQDIKIQMDAIETNINLILTNERLRASIDESTAVQNLAIAAAEKKPQATMDKLQIEVSVAKAYNKLLGSDKATPDLTGDVATRAGLTPGSIEARQLQLKTMAVRNSLGAQNAALTEQKGAMTAANVTGERARRTGKLEDEQKVLDLTTAVNQANIGLRNTLSSISGVMSDQIILAEDKIAKQVIDDRQLQERKTIEAAIANAGKDTLQKTNLEQQQTLILKKQGLESDLQSLQTRQKLLQIEIDNIGKRYELTRSNAELEKTIAQSNLEVRAQELAIAGALYGVSKDYLINQQSIIDKEKILLDTSTAMQAAEDAFGQKREEAEKRIAALRASKDPKALEDEKIITQELDRQEQLKNNTVAGLNVQLKTRNKIIDATKSAGLEQEKINKAIEDINKQYEVQRSNGELEYTRASAMIDIRTQELNLYGSLYGLSKSFMINQEASLASEKLTLENTKARKIAEDELTVKRKTAEEQIAALKLATNTLTDQEKVKAEAKIKDELARQGLLTANTIAQLDIEFTTRSRILSLTQQTNLEQERYNQLITTSNDLASTLTSVFGQLGTSIGTLTTSFTEMAIASEKSAKTIQNLELSRDLETDAGVRKKLNDEIEEQRNKSTKAELAGYSKVAGAAKSLFKEKTGAYKALDKIEKTMHLQRIALDLKEFALKMGLISKEQIASFAAGAKELAMKANNALVSIGIDIPAIYAKTIGQLGVFGPPVAAAMIAAFVGSAFGKGGGSGNFVPTAAQRQETQGTAMGYDASGNLVQTSRGTFGDTGAKSESIANSLTIIKDNSVAGLSYDNKMLRALEGLNDALVNTAKGLYRVAGIRSGSLSGVTEGTNTSGGFLGIGGLFSSSTSKSIIDSGIQLRGTFLDLVKGLSGTISTFETVSTTVKKSGVLGFGGSTKTNVTTSFADLETLDPKAFKSLTNAFGYAADLLYTVAESADKSAEIVTEAMSQIRVDQMASLRGLTGEEFTKELSAVIGSVLDETSYVIFSEFEKFASFGEGMLETVIRVTDTNKKVLQQLSNLGASIELIAPDINKASMDITEDLVNLAGGLDKFLDQTNYFLDNFLSETERIIPTQKAVVQQLKDLGYANIDTKDEFKTLIQTFKLTDAASRKTYQSLLELAPGFIDTLKVIEDSFAETKSKLKETSTAFLDFAKNIRSFRESLVLGAQSTATPTEKLAEAKNQFDAIYAAALGGDKDAMGKLTSSASTVLELGKTLYASGSDYTSLFNSISTRLAEAEVSALSSADVANLQLTALESTVSILTRIDTNIALLAGAPAKAAGGLARGMTLVGEMGPELVDFSYPGRVYTADQTAGMFSPVNSALPTAEIVNELRQLKQELAQLRKDQQKQTGDLIISNYDAHSKSSEEIATAIVTTGEDTMWTERSKSEIK